MLDTVPERIVEIGSRISGISSYGDPPPPSLQSSQLPFVYVLTGAAVETEEGTDYNIETRTYRVRVAVVGIGEANPYVRETKCRLLLDLLKKQYRAYPVLDHLEWVQNSKVVGDTGIVILPDYGEEFVGFEIQLEVQVVEQRIFLE